MSTHRSFRRLAAAGLLAVSVVAVGCSDDTETATEDSTSETTMRPTTTMAEDMSSDTTMGSESGDMASSEPFGPGCAAVPKDGAGSFSGMSQDPAATAASNNPVLSTLVSAVQKAGLVDTLNGPGPFTIFAPTNDAFAKIPAADLQAVLDDPETLTKILTFHVVPGQMSAEDLADAGTATTVEGEDLTFSGDATSLTVNGSAAVVCGDVQVANATVHIIDSVLMPG